jgi:hypothetical protein
MELCPLVRSGYPETSKIRGPIALAGNLSTTKGIWLPAFVVENAHQLPPICVLATREG